MAIKLVNFKCPPELEAAIEAYGRKNFLYESPRGGMDYDRSKAVRALIVAGLEAENGEARLDYKKNVIASWAESDIETITAEITAQFEERFAKLEELLAKK